MNATVVFIAYVSVTEILHDNKSSGRVIWRVMLWIRVVVGHHAGIHLMRIVESSPSGTLLTQSA